MDDAAWERLIKRAAAAFCADRYPLDAALAKVRGEEKADDAT